MVKAGLHSDCRRPKLVPFPTHLSLPMGKVYIGDLRTSGLSLARLGKVSVVPPPALASIPGKDSTWLGAFIKFLFFNYILIVTNPNNTKVDKGGGEGLSFPFQFETFFFASDMRS